MNKKVWIIKRVIEEYYEVTAASKKDALASEILDPNKVVVKSTTCKQYKPKKS